jgi:hypothetical protein
MTMSKSMQRALSLQARLEKLADSKDEKVASKAVSDLTTLHISETEIEAREDRIMPLREEIAELKRKLATADELLSPVTTERDALLTEMSGLREQVAKFATVETEFTELNSNFDAKILEARKELVEEAQRHSWDAQRAENNMKFKLDEAKEKFGQAGLQLLLDEVKKIVEQYKVPEPDPTTLPKGISSFYLTLWGRSPSYAHVAMAFAHITEPTPAFKEALYRVLSVGLPAEGVLVMPDWRDEHGEPHRDYPKPDVVPDLAARREVLTAMAIKFGCLQEVQDRVDQKHAEILGHQREEQLASLSRQEADLQRLGYGRSPIGVEEKKPQVIDPHTWSGFIPANPTIVSDFNDWSMNNDGDNDGPTRQENDKEPR